FPVRPAPGLLRERASQTPANDNDRNNSDPAIIVRVGLPVTDAAMVELPPAASSAARRFCNWLCGICKRASYSFVSGAISNDVCRTTRLSLGFGDCFGRGRSASTTVVTVSNKRLREQIRRIAFMLVSLGWFVGD